MWRLESKKGNRKEKNQSKVDGGGTIAVTILQLIMVGFGLFGEVIYRFKFWIFMSSISTGMWRTQQFPTLLTVVYAKKEVPQRQALCDSLEN